MAFVLGHEMQWSRKVRSRSKNVVVPVLCECVVPLPTSSPRCRKTENPYNHEQAEARRDDVANVMVCTNNLKKIDTIMHTTSTPNTPTPSERRPKRRSIILLTLLLLLVVVVVGGGGVVAPPRKHWHHKT